MLTFNAIGFDYPVTVHTANWIRSPLYTAAELPKHKPKFTKLARRPNPNPGDDQIHVSRKFLREMCKDLDPNTLPEEVRTILQDRSLQSVITLDQAEHLVNLPLMVGTAST